MFRFVSEHGVLLKNAAVIYDHTEDSVFVSDCRDGKHYDPIWCYKDEAARIIVRYGLTIINRSGKCLTLLGE